MSASFEAIVLSRLFTFVVGTDAVPIVVHEATIADQSPELAALTRGKMSKCLVAEATWEDVDKETFIIFAQFAYIGDHTTPQMITEPTEILPSIDTWDFGPVKKAGKKHVPGPPEPIPAFKNFSYPLPIPRFNFADTCHPTVAEGPSENIGEILTIHASLYILAEKWGIDRLKRLALFKIHKTLNLFSLDISKLDMLSALCDTRTPMKERQI
ncbi:hypothetical protein LSUB1_G007779 [Lachnellula subtilissima]|uniref:BTB domain-containing protein n=1 Tax=Lachnellula subtilissima TaxID=602034 RepID=A0A8H8RAU5_9HELO|nr:hypothetical protein LSUB1_G007779 [Lachnellula subtilissima]